MSILRLIHRLSTTLLNRTAWQSPNVLSQHALLCPVLRGINYCVKRVGFSHLLSKSR